MTPRQEQVAKVLTEVATQLSEVVTDWGFAFHADEVRSSHGGPFASGHFCRETTRIGISCRDTLDNLTYEHTFVTRRGNSTESERFTIGHATLMAGVGHAQDCHLISSGELPSSMIARDGDPVEALIYDLTVLAKTVLSAPCDEFFTIMRQGYRSYNVTY